MALPTSRENFTPAATPCFECGRFLIKQHLTKDNKPLTEEQRRDLHLAIKTNTCTLQCESCAGLCWRLKQPPVSGMGLCKRCGGKDRLTRPKELMDYHKAGNVYQQYALVIWSCPVHGALFHNTL